MGDVGLTCLFMVFVYVFVTRGFEHMDTKKVYVATRFQTAASKSDSEFDVELHRALNCPDKCVCYIDDIVIPVSWTSIDERNNLLDLEVQIDGVLSSFVLSFESSNYSGTRFAEVFQSKVNAALLVYQISVSVTYELANNKLLIILNDNRQR